MDDRHASTDATSACHRLRDDETMGKGDCRAVGAAPVVSFVAGAGGIGVDAADFDSGLAGGRSDVSATQAGATTGWGGGDGFRAGGARQTGDSALPPVWLPRDGGLGEAGRRLRHSALV